MKVGIHPKWPTCQVFTTKRKGAQEPKGLNGDVGSPFHETFARGENMNRTLCKEGRVRF
jgi:hypothetical protein